MTGKDRMFLLSEMSNMDLAMDCSLDFNLDVCMKMSDKQLQDEYRHMKEIYSFIMAGGERI